MGKGEVLLWGKSEGVTPPGRTDDELKGSELQTPRVQVCFYRILNRQADRGKGEVWLWGKGEGVTPQRLKNTKVRMFF